MRGDSSGLDGDSVSDWTEGQRSRSGDTVETISVVAVGMTFAGRDDVTAFVQRNHASADTTYLSYLENGDLALAMPHPFGGDRWMWATFPMGNASRADTILRLDTVLREMPVRIELISSYGGSERMSAAGSLFDVRRGNMSFRVFYSTPTGQMYGGVEQNIWFAPAIGFLVRKEERGIGIDASGKGKRTVMSLKAYRLR